MASVPVYPGPYQEATAVKVGNVPVIGVPAPGPTAPMPGRARVAPGVAAIGSASTTAPLWASTGASPGRLRSARNEAGRPRVAPIGDAGMSAAAAAPVAGRPRPVTASPPPPVVSTGAAAARSFAAISRSRRTAAPRRPLTSCRSTPRLRRAATRRSLRRCSEASAVSSAAVVAR